MRALDQGFAGAIIGTALILIVVVIGSLCLITTESITTRCLAFPGLTSPRHMAPLPPPRIMLWAWERPEDLRFIDTKNTGVAFLAATIKIKAGKVDVSNVRHQPLRVPPSTYLMSVVRIESDGSPGEKDDQMIRAIAVVVPGFLKPGVRAMQFDFDARKSERVWYGRFLTQMRDLLPNDVFLSMTSLASWCLGDDWLTRSHLPVDEVVPMFFEMGSDSQPIALLLESGNTYGHSYQAIGISDKEPSINRLLGKTATSILKPVPRFYLFSRTAWTQKKAQALMREVDSWQ